MSHGRWLMAISDQNWGQKSDERILRWGQSFNDPVHIDDYLNGKNPSKWDELYQNNQKC